MTNRIFQLLALALISMVLFGLLHIAPYSQNVSQTWTSGSRAASEALQFGRPLVRRQLAAFDWSRQNPSEPPAGTLVIYTFSNTDSGMAPHDIHKDISADMMLGCRCASATCNRLTHYEFLKYR